MLAEDLLGREAQAKHDAGLVSLQGVIVYFRVVDGELKPGDTIRLINTGKEYEVDEVGVLSPKQIPVRLSASLSTPLVLTLRTKLSPTHRPTLVFLPSLRPASCGALDLTHHALLQVDRLYAGEVGYLAASIKAVADARVGDTITLKKQGSREALAGYREVVPMVFCGLFPTDADQFGDLREALGRLQLNDAALSYEPEARLSLSNAPPLHAACACGLARTVTPGHLLPCGAPCFAE